MSGFFRPEAMALVMRWREALIAVAVGGLGLWIALRPGPIVSGFGYALAAFGGILLFLALRRIRFARKGAGEGPGVVTLDEGRIAYLGPYYGGTLAVQDLTRLALRRGDDDAVFWVLAHPDGVLVIPANAVGADVLFDAFTTLPGLNMEFLLRNLNRGVPGTITLWSAQDRPALT